MKMRWSLTVVLAAVCGLMLQAQGRADEKPKSKDLVINGELTDQDAKDRVRENMYCKIYTFKMVKGHTYQIDMTSNDVDSYLRLENPAGEQVAFDDDGGGFPSARIRYVAADSGDFKIIATTFGANSTGKFNLTARDLSAPAVVGKGKDLVINGELTNNDAKDRVRENMYCKIYTFKMVKGATYQIDMVSNDLDSYLRLENPAGEQVAFDDDGGGFPSARIVFMAKESGDYKIIATTYAANTTGKFTLTARDTAASAMALKLVDGKASANSSINRQDPKYGNKNHKVFTVQLEKGKAYQLDMVSGDFDSYLFLHGPDMKLLAQDDDGGGFPDARINFTADETGTYRIVCTYFGGGGNLGNFTLTVAEK